MRVAAEPPFDALHLQLTGRKTLLLLSPTNNDRHELLMHLMFVRRFKMMPNSRWVRERMGDVGGEEEVEEKMRERDQGEEDGGEEDNRNNNEDEDGNDSDDDEDDEDDEHKYDDADDEQEEEEEPPASSAQRHLLPIDCPTSFSAWTVHTANGVRA